MPFINGFGPFEVIILLIIALIVVGPGKLPDVGAALGKSIREFRKAATDVKESTSLDPTPARPAAAPSTPQAASPVSAADATPPPAPPAVGASTPPAPVAAAPGAVATAGVAADLPPAPPSAEALEVAGETAPNGDWPAEVVPADEQQPTRS